MVLYGWMWWWWLWMIFLLILLVPTGYGWRYRGWGPPYPSYYRRRRTLNPTDAPTGWGRAADLLWLGFFIMIFWLVLGGIWWRR